MLLAAKLVLGLSTRVSPLKITWLVSLMLMVRVSVALLSTKLPLPASTTSLKVSFKLLASATAVAPLAGDLLLRVGAVVSPATKPSTDFKASLNCTNSTSLRVAMAPPVLVSM